MFGESICLPSASLSQGAFLFTTFCSGAKPRPTLINQSRRQWTCRALAFWLKKTWSSCSSKGYWCYRNHQIPSFLTLSCMKWKHKELDLHQAVVWPSDVLSHGDSWERESWDVNSLSICRVVFCNWPSQWVPSVHLGMHEIVHGTWRIKLMFTSCATRRKCDHMCSLLTPLQNENCVEDDSDLMTICLVEFQTFWKCSMNNCFLCLYHCFLMLTWQVCRLVFI